MTQEEIEGNRLIAEFMGLRYKSNGYPSPYWLEGSRKVNFLLYNSSWDWLMPVVEKVAKVEEMGSLGNTIDYLIARMGWKPSDFNNISDLWLAVVEYIKWYQSQSK